MPTYEFRCPNGHTFDELHKISDAPSTATCPVCGAEAVRAISGGAGLVFKGSGFYLTDYGKNAHRTSGPATAGTESKGEGKTESKPDSGKGGKESASPASGGSSTGGSGGSSGGSGGASPGGSASGGSSGGASDGGSKSGGSKSGSPKSGGSTPGGAAA